jgi:hypothetical protein
MFARHSFGRNDHDMPEDKRDPISLEYELALAGV